MKMIQISNMLSFEEFGYFLDPEEVHLKSRKTDMSKIVLWNAFSLRVKTVMSEKIVTNRLTIV
jgi:hypothetical protein